MISLFVFFMLKIQRIFSVFCSNYELFKLIYFLEYTNRCLSNEFEIESWQNRGKRRKRREATISERIESKRGGILCAGVRPNWPSAVEELTLSASLGSNQGSNSAGDSERLTDWETVQSSCFSVLWSCPTGSRERQTRTASKTNLFGKRRSETRKINIGDPSMEHGASTGQRTLAAVCQTLDAGPQHEISETESRTDCRSLAKVTIAGAWNEHQISIRMV